MSFKKAESQTGIAFQITPKALRPVRKDPSSCWYNLFRHSVVASGFEIPSRQCGTGLELTLELMAELTENAKPLKYAGKFLMISLHSALIPTVIWDDQSIQWHLFTSSNCDGISLQDLPEESVLPVPATCNNDLDIRSFFQALKIRRHFLGWCRNARITLGTCPREGGKYTLRDFTKTPETSKEVKFSSFNAGIASSGLGYAGPSFSGTWTITSTRKHFSDTPIQRFESMLSIARRMPSILYNPEERRAWMVPLICVLYHMAHLRIMVDGHSPCLPYVKSSWDGASIVYETIVSNRQISIGPQDPRSPYLLSDLLEHLWLNLQLVKAEQPGRRTWLWQSSLYGCELMDIVSGVPPFRLKKAHIRDCGGWIKLMREIEVVFFCNGVGEVIAPKDPHADTCRSWSSVLRGQDFLCVTIGCLQQLSGRAGSSPRCEILARDCYWHSPEPLFDSCNCCNGSSCNPLQQVVEDKMWAMFRIKRAQSPSKMVTEGAVIFGENARYQSLPEATKSQPVDSANDSAISEQQVRAVHISNEPSLLQTSYRVSRTQTQRHLRRCAKSENLRICIGQPAYARQRQNISH